MELRICHIYPDVLNLYGDRGNILCLVRRLAWRGIGCTVTELPIGVNDTLADYDLFFVGGGQDFEQKLLLDDLGAGRAKNIRSAVLDGKTFLAICGGYQLLGRSYCTADGTVCEYVGALDLETHAGETRMIGNAACRTKESCVLVGFENHAGKTQLGKDLAPLGTVLKGQGNNGDDGGEGVRFNNVFGTYYHGPVLPKNPAFCDLLLLTALQRKYGKAEIEPLDDSVENAAREAVLSQMGLSRKLAFG